VFIYLLNETIRLLVLCVGEMFDIQWINDNDRIMETAIFVTRYHDGAIRRARWL